MSTSNSIRNGIKWLITGSLGGQVLQFVARYRTRAPARPGGFRLHRDDPDLHGVRRPDQRRGHGQALVQSKEAGARDFDVVFTAQLLIGILIFAGFYLAAPWFARSFGDPLYADLIRVSAISFLLRPFVNTEARARCTGTCASRSAP